MRPPDDQLVREVLLRHVAWLEEHCERLARKLPWAGNAEDVAAELFQEAAERFLVGGRRFLSQETRISQERHERYALSQFALHAATALGRKHGPKKIDRRVDAIRVLETRGPDRDAPQPTPEDALGDEERHALLRQLFTFRDGDNPRRHLAVLALEHPAWVERADFERVVGYRKGGARGLPRPVDETWRHFAGGRDSEVASRPTEWKRFVAELLLLEGPFRTAGADDVRRAVNNLENLVKRATLELRDRARALGLGEEFDR